MKKGDWIYDPNDGDIWQLEIDAEPGSYAMEDCILWEPIHGSDYIAIKNDEDENSFTVAIFNKQLHDNLKYEPYLGPLLTWLLKN